MIKKQKGFSMMEVTVSLLIISVATTSSYMFYQRMERSHRRENEIQKLQNFAKATTNFIAANQAVAYNTSGKITISPEKLIQYGYLTKKEFNNISDPDTQALIYPCATIYVENEKLQGFIYYRTDDNKMQKSSFDNVNKNSNSKNRIEQLFTGLNNFGGNAGILTIDNNGQYILKGKNANWKMTDAQINSYLLQNGVPFLGDNINSCKGSGIAVPSYTMSLQDSLSSISSQLNADNTVRQNSNEIVNSNRINQTDVLSMDSTGISATPFSAVSKNKLVFQTNPNCVMNPSILSTMQDYDPTYNPKGCSSSNDSACSGYNVANIFGCRNKQLTLGVQNATVNNTSLQAVVINGFTEVNTQYATGNLHNYLGILNADTIQATAKVGYSDNCDGSELGAMAQQKDYTKTDNLSKLYSLNQSLLVCQKSLLCEQDSSFNANPDPSKVNQCWLPISNITVDVNLDPAAKVLAYQAPKGFYIVPGSVTYIQKPDQQLNNMNNGGVRYGSFNYDNGAAGKTSDCQDTNCIIDSPFGCIWEVHAHGFFRGLNRVQSDNIFAPPSLLNTPIDDINGWTVWKDSNSTSFDGGGRGGYTAGKYVTSVASINNDFSEVYQTNEQAKNWANSQQDVSYKFKSSFPYIANSKWDFRVAVYSADQSPQQLQKCASWHSNQIVTFPYYITKVSISNDTDKLIVDSTNPPVVPPIPIPSGTCSTSNIPADIQSTGASKANTYRYDGNTGESVVLASPSNINMTSSNLTSGTCYVKTTANYCPQTGECDVWAGSYQTPCRNGADNYQAGFSCQNGSTMTMQGNCWARKTYTCTEAGLNEAYPGFSHSCQTRKAASLCTNPVTKLVYETTYQVQ